MVQGNVECRGSGGARGRTFWMEREREIKICTGRGREHRPRLGQRSGRGRGEAMVHEDVSVERDIFAAARSHSRVYFNVPRVAAQSSEGKRLRVQEAGGAEAQEQREERTGRDPDRARGQGPGRGACTRQGGEGVHRGHDQRFGSGRGRGRSHGVEGETVIVSRATSFVRLPPRSSGRGVRVHATVRRGSSRDRSRNKEK